jgi:hypothetical protein
MCERATGWVIHRAFSMQANIQPYRMLPVSCSGEFVAFQKRRDECPIRGKESASEGLTRGERDSKTHAHLSKIADARNFKK